MCMTVCAVYLFVMFVCLFVCVVCFFVLFVFVALLMLVDVGSDVVVNAVVGGVDGVDCYWSYILLSAFSISYQECGYELFCLCSHC